MSIGAPIDEVWAEALSYGSRAAPGSSTRKQTASQSTATNNKKKTASPPPPIASCAKSDPLCDLYEKGYSSAFDDIMDSYSAGDDMYDRSGYTRTQDALPGTGVLTNAGGRDSQGSDQLDDVMGMPGYDPSAMAFGDGAAPFSSASADRNKKPISEDRRQNNAKSAASDDDDDESYEKEQKEQPKHPQNPHNKTYASSPPYKTGTPQPDIFRHDADRASLTRTTAMNAFEVVLYIASGLMLIFMMETFVQMGARMRY